MIEKRMKHINNGTYVRRATSRSCRSWIESHRNTYSDYAHALCACVCVCVVCLILRQIKTLSRSACNLTLLPLLKENTKKSFSGSACVVGSQSHSRISSLCVCARVPSVYEPSVNVQRTHDKKRMKHIHNVTYLKRATPRSCRSWNRMKHRISDPSAVYSLRPDGPLPSWAAKYLEKKTRRFVDFFCAPTSLLPRVNPRLTRRLIKPGAPDINFGLIETFSRVGPKKGEHAPGK